jgi:hypothetical protein
MKILEIITSLSSGGGERFVVDLCNELSTFQTCEVELLTIKDDTLHDYGFYKNELSQSVKYTCLKENKFTLKTPQILHPGTVHSLLPNGRIEALA